MIAKAALFYLLPVIYFATLFYLGRRIKKLGNSQIVDADYLAKAKRLYRICLYTILLLAAIIITPRQAPIFFQIMEKIEVTLFTGCFLYLAVQGILNFRCRTGLTMALRVMAMLGCIVCAWSFMGRGVD